MDGRTFYLSFEPVLMEWIQSRMGSPGTAAASLFTMFGEELALIAVLGFLYWCYDKEYAKFVGTSVLIGTVLNPMIKNIALRRRPYFDHPQIKCLRPVDADADIYDIAAQGYSFPSGHSMNGTIVYASLAAKRRRAVLILPAIVLPFLIGLSRVMLGVHYPTDVLAGWLAGAAVVWLAMFVQRRVKDRGKLRLVILLCAAPGLLYCRTADYFTSFGMMAGFFAGAAFEEKKVGFSGTRDPLRCVLRLAGGILIFFVLNAVLKLPFPAAFLEGGSLPALLVRTCRYALTLFVLIGLYPMLFDK